MGDRSTATQTNKEKGDSTDTAAQKVAHFTGASPKTVENVLPIVAAVGTAALGISLADSLSKLGRGFFGLIKKVVTFGGYLEKIPVVGVLFSGLGKMLDWMGSMSGYAITGLASFLAYKMLQVPVRHVGDKATEDTPNTGTGVKPDPAVKKTIEVVKQGSTKAKAEVPMAPAPVESKKPAGMSDAAYINAQTKTYAELKELRRQALSEHDGTLQEAYRQLMREQNKLSRTACSI